MTRWKIGCFLVLLSTAPALADDWDPNCGSAPITTISIKTVPLKQVWKPQPAVQKRWRPVGKSTAVAQPSPPAPRRMAKLLPIETASGPRNCHSTRLLPAPELVAPPAPGLLLNRLRAVAARVDTAPVPPPPPPTLPLVNVPFPLIDTPQPPPPLPPPLPQQPVPEPTTLLVFAPAVAAIRLLRRSKS